MVEVTHGRILHERCKRPCEPLWAVGRNHQDVELDSAYLPRLRSFLKEVFDAPPSSH